MTATAWRPSELDVVERKSSVISIFTAKLLYDAEYATQTRNINAGLTKVLVQATYLINILYNRNLRSSFEKGGVYSTSFLDIPKTQISP